jgi:hypothetical protein
MSQWLKTQLTSCNRSAWTAEEDGRLRQVVNEHGAKNWTRIALAFNIDPSKKGRTKRQCKDHWENYLNPNTSQ